MEMWMREPIRAVYLNDHRGARVWAYYLQDDFSIRKNLIFVAGLRSNLIGVS